MKSESNEISEPYHTTRKRQRVQLYSVSFFVMKNIRSVMKQKENASESNFIPADKPVGLGVPFGFQNE